jgi:hypothetical protein
MIKEIRVFDMTGRMVWSQEIGGNAATLDFSGWNKGLYLVSVATGDRIFTRRIIK